MERSTLFFRKHPLLLHMQEQGIVIVRRCAMRRSISFCSLAKQCLRQAAVRKKQSRKNLKDL